MKINKWISYEAETEVHISAEEIAAAITEDANPETSVLLGINNFATFMKGAPDEAIEALTDSQKNVIRTFLLEQAQRLSIQEADKLKQSREGATNAMQGLYQRIGELEEYTTKLQQENAELKAQIPEHDEGLVEQCMTVNQFMKERNPLAEANKALQFETQDQPAAQNTELRDEMEKHSHLQLIAKLLDGSSEAYQQVPIVPTEAMLDAVVAVDQGDKELRRTLAREQWDMMLKAALTKDETEYLQSFPPNNERLQQAIEHILDESDE